MTANAISFQDLLIWRGRQPSGRGFENVFDVSRHVRQRTDQFNLRDENATVAGVLNLHQRGVLAGMMVSMR